MTSLINSMDEFRRMLPEAFVTAYESLFVAAYRDGGVDASHGGHPLSGEGTVVGRANGQIRRSGVIGGGGGGSGWRLNSGVVDIVAGTMGPQKENTRRVGKTSDTLRDEKAYRLKLKFDKRLRKIAREIVAGLEGKNVVAAGNRICAGKCKKFGDYEWSFCARCGGPMREIEQDEITVE
jgi:hypothetical protein